MKPAFGIALASLLALQGFVAVQPTGAAPRWERLFDGRTLGGWTPKIVGEAAGEDAGRTFIVKDGKLQVSYASYGGKFAGRFGHLFYDRPLRFFRLRLRYRFLEPGLPDAPTWAHSNSGIMLLSENPRDMGRDQNFPVSIEFQLLGRDGDKPRPTGAVCTPGTDVDIGGKRAAEHCTPSNGPTISNGTWVQAELDVLPSGEILHRINGKVVQRYTNARLDPTDPIGKDAVARAGSDLRLTRGYIALQSEGHPVEFDNVELQILGE